MSSVYSSGGHSETNAFTTLIVDSVNAAIAKLDPRNRRLLLSDQLRPKMEKLFKITTGDDDYIKLQLTDQTAAEVTQYARDYVITATQKGKNPSAADVFETTLKYFTSNQISVSNEGDRQTAAPWHLTMRVYPGWASQETESSLQDRKAARGWIEEMKAVQDVQKLLPEEWLD